MTNLGIKIITYENWMNPDPLMKNLVMLQDDKISIMSAGDWAISILKPKLSETVPLEIHKLFEVARGSMLYGYFFYPLFTLAFEQLLRVAEAAISEKCRQITTDKVGNNTFKDKIARLNKNKFFSDEEYTKWNLLRNLRNLASHPNEQAILPPGITLEFIFNISELINSLFTQHNQKHN
ncbi:hypothetical protein [Nitrosomonas sp.]|uniref:hypothetical protein n=1 Tax=Nitrosomonas sp. TaxID=42353 RepID=UPI0025DE1014|nr:hypothetical protein [Nitrosomonas sp.]